MEIVLICRYMSFPWGSADADLHIWVPIIGDNYWYPSSYINNDIHIGVRVCVVLLSLQWRHNGRDDVSDHQRHDCLLSRLFRRRSKETSKLRVTGLCAGNSPVTGEIPARRACNANNVSIWWRHHDVCLSQRSERVPGHQLVKSLKQDLSRTRYNYPFLVWFNYKSFHTTYSGLGFGIFSYIISG